MDEVKRAMERSAKGEPGAGARAVDALHREAVRAVEFITEGVATRADIQNMRADARAVMETADAALGNKVDGMATIDGRSPGAGRRAAEDLGRSALMAIALIEDGQMARADVQYVRVSARRALGAAARALGRTNVAAQADNPKSAFDVLVMELTALRERSIALSTTVGGKASGRLAAAAQHEAQVEAVLDVALHLLTVEEFAALVRAVGLESYTA